MFGYDCALDDVREVLRLTNRGLAEESANGAPVRSR